MKRYFQNLLLVTVLLFSSACEIQQRQTAGGLNSNLGSGIINGKPVGKNDATFWMTSRVLQKNVGVWFPVCTASILSKELILTAAHCVEYAKLQDLRIAFGAQPLSGTDQMDPEKQVDVEAKFTTIAVKAVAIHPKYGSSETDHDMALLLLAQEIPEKFKAVPLLSQVQMESIQENQKYDVLLVGYGLLSESPMVESKILRRTIVPARFEGKHLVTDQTGGSGGCNGDSGGPAYLRMGRTLHLVGVTHGPGQGPQDCKHEGIWGNPNHEKDFLNKSAQSFGVPTRF